MKSVRQKEILQILEREKVINTIALSKHFNVAVETIRRDFDQLEAQGAIKKVYGGAKLPDGASTIWPSIDVRNNSFTAEKTAIAKLAQQFISPNSTIALDAGSTMVEFCRQLKILDSLVIICSDIHCANQILSSTENKVYMMGGFLTPDGTSFGDYANEFISSISAIDTFVCSTDGISHEGGPTTNANGINELKRCYIKKSEKIVLLADHSKFVQKGFYKMCEFSDIDVIITDSGTPAPTIHKIRQLGVNVLIAEV